MSEWTVDIVVRVTSDTPQEAAALCQAMLEVGRQTAPELGLSLMPCLIGIRRGAAAPEKAEPETPTAPDTAAADVFGTIMSAPDM